MENKIEIKLYLYCPCCNKNLTETSIWIEPEFSGRIGRLPNEMPCIDCWNREMGFFGDAEEKKEKSKKQRMLEEDEKDMHTGEGDEKVDEIKEDKTEEQEQEDERF